MSYRVLFWGTPTFAVPTLQKLIESKEFDVCGVITAPAKHQGRSKILTPTPVASIAELHAIPTHTPTTLKTSEAKKLIESLKPDVCVVVAYGKIIPEALLSIPRHGFINAHPSKLPQYRGPAPLQYAIKDGVTQSAISIMRIDAEMDHGPILLQEPFIIAPDEYFSDVLQRAARESAELMHIALMHIKEGTAQKQPQDHDHATFSHMVTRETGRISWEQSSEAIYNHIRAFAQEPGAWTPWNGEDVRIHRAHALPESVGTGAPGTVYAYAQGSFLVTCGSGVLAVDSLQQPGGKLLPASLFLNGNKAFFPNISLP
ncbi:MAG: methionyl-tRNA formyltransferase [Patescibacteria group bacterium]